MIIRKAIKKEAKKKLKKNYRRTIAIIFFMAIVLGNFSFLIKSRITIPNIHFTSPVAGVLNVSFESYSLNLPSYKPTRGILANVFNNIISSGNFIFGMVNSFNQLIFQNHLWKGLIILLGAFLSLFYWLFVQNVLLVGEKRFFLENKNHKKTKFIRIFLPYKVKKIKNVAFTMLVVTIKEWIWYLTIIGGFIKHYSYCLVPYILAENLGIDGKEAIKLSEDLMKGHKWELFKFDLSFLGWYLLDIFTLHFVGILFVRPYKKCCETEIYFYLRKIEKIKNIELLKDKELETVEDTYPAHQYMYKEIEAKKWLHTDFNKKYSLNSILLMFFTASIIGWLWEVGLNLFQYGFFANRGTLYGPWLPIYGWGLLFILLILKRFRNRPIFTFFSVIVLCGILEYGTAWFLETFKNARWWDYDGFFLNLHGRICLEGLLAFGIAGTFFIYFVAPFLDSLYLKIPKKAKTILCILLCSFYVFDFIYSSKYPNMGEGVSQSFQIKKTEY